jgi:hypothetical protein
MSAEETAWLTSSKKGSRRAKLPQGTKQTTKLLLTLDLPLTLNYTKEEEQWAKDEKGIKEKGGWWKFPDQRLFVPSAIAVPW